MSISIEIRPFWDTFTCYWYWTVISPTSKRSLARSDRSYQTQSSCADAVEKHFGSDIPVKLTSLIEAAQFALKYSRPLFWTNTFLLDPRSREGREELEQIIAGTMVINGEE